MLKLSSIDNPIAEDIWNYIDSDGNKKSAKVIVGAPIKLNESEWYCPVSIENYTKIVPAYGIGPVDSLMNAMTLVKSFFYKIHKQAHNSDSNLKP